MELLTALFDYLDHWELIFPMIILLGQIPPLGPLAGAGGGAAQTGFNVVELADGTTETYIFGGGQFNLAQVEFPDGTVLQGPDQLAGYTPGQGTGSPGEAQPIVQQTPISAGAFQPPGSGVSIPGGPSPVPRTTEQLAFLRAEPLLGALEELRVAQEPGVERRAFSTFAQRGFGLSPLAGRGVREAVGEFRAGFAREREQIRSRALEQALEEQFRQEQISALRAT